jgi:predicted lactoylglutathione lyase
MNRRRQTYVNLPVADLRRTVDFFTRLGFGFNPDFTDDRAACMIISDDSFVMLLERGFFAGFATTPVADGSTTEVTIGISAADPDEVNRLVTVALDSGGSPAGDPMADGPMYGWSFKDPDGHHWEIIHMQNG